MRAGRTSLIFMKKIKTSQINIFSILGLPFYTSPLLKCSKSSSHTIVVYPDLVFTCTTLIILVSSILHLVSTHLPIAYDPHWSCSVWVDAGLAGHWSYIHTIRKPRIHGQVVEVKTQLTHRDYINMLAQRDDSHFTIFKRRRCFLDNNQYFQLDIYKEPCHPRSV